MSKKALRRRLYKQYAMNFSLMKSVPGIDIQPDIPGSIACPLCLCLLDKSDLVDSQRITLDHVPPSALGGRDADGVLLCSTCNHQLGSKVDAQLLRTTKADRFAKGHPGIPVDGRLSIGPSAGAAAEMQYTAPGALTIFLDKSRSDRAQFTSMIQHLESASQKAPLTGRLEFRGGRKANSEAGLLRIGYLLLFREFGYAAILTEGMNAVRAQIISPDERVITQRWELPLSFPSTLPLGISMIVAPKELCSVLAVFDLDVAGVTSRHAVVLPGPDHLDTGVYDRLDRAVTGEQKTQVRGIPISPSPRIWTDKEACLAIYHCRRLCEN